MSEPEPFDPKDLEQITEIEDQNDRKQILGILSGTGYNINQIIGAGIFQSPGNIWWLVQSPGIALIFWAIGGVVSLFGSLVYIELGIRTYRSGIGEQIYIDEAFYCVNNLGHIFSLVAIFAIFPAGIIADSYTSAKYLLYAIEGNSYSSNDNKIILPAVTISILGIITVYHVFNNRLPVYINQTLALIKLFALLIISIVGLVKLITNDNNWKSIFDTYSPNLGDYTSAMIKILFAYGGVLKKSKILVARK
ncbi:1588_t:CDS:2 [Dentiscutata erythropus]|uniref:1588_t:CDS:1 n=1 Tax=Dentiscutata erythropus TaxID=1348616 RepID=A0A9N9DVQ9_9GLOM|nr:1588_t:CDS:2 [Dentiscutata erythropus]